MKITRMRTIASVLAVAAATTFFAGDLIADTIQKNFGATATLPIVLSGSQVSGTLPVTKGGTGFATATQGDLIYGSAANTLAKLAKSTSSTRYLSNTGTSNNPAWAQVALDTGVSGTLPVANGGTNLTSSSDDNVMVGNGTTWQSKAVADCDDTGGNHLNYDTGTNAFSCGTSGSGGGGTTFYPASLAADSVFTTVTLADRLSVSSLPAGNYAFEAWFRITQTGGGADLKMAVYSGATPDSNNFETLFGCSDGVTTQSIGPSPWQSGGTSPAANAFDFSGGSQCVFHTIGSIELPSTADVRLQWAQNTATGTTTISRGAWMRLMKVN